MTDDAVIEHFRSEMASLGARFVIDTACRRFRDPDLAAALAMWRDHCPPDGLPTRRSLTPQVMRRFLKKVAIFERIAAPFGTFRYRARLTGQEFALAYADLSGKYLDEVVPAKYLVRWKKLGDVVLAWGGPVRYLTVTEAFGREYSALEHFIAPLLDNAGNPTQLLFVCNFERGCAWDAIIAEEGRFAANAPGASPT